MAKEFKIIDEIFPYDTEATINVKGKFSSDLRARIKRGNFITPDHVKFDYLNFFLIGVERKSFTS